MPKLTAPSPGGSGEWLALRPVLFTTTSLCDALQVSTSAVCPLQRLAAARRCGPVLDFQSFRFLSVVITL